MATAIETVADALAETAETERLLRRATTAVEHAAYFGPKKLGEFVEPVARIFDALSKKLP